jgi:COMPASS component SWD2
MYCWSLEKIISWIFQGLLRVQGRPAVSYDDQGMVFAVAYGGQIRMFDARKFEKVS